MLPLVTIIGLFGLAIGSFLNVIIHRVPTQASLMRPSSYCPACGHRIRNRHNVPLLGWLMLRGRCADCQARISARYPLVELSTATVFIALAVKVAEENRLAVLPAVLYFAAMGISLSLIDLDVGRLPNAIVYPSYVVLAVLLAIAAFAQSDPAALLRAAVGAVALFLLYFACAFLYPAGMGFGDVKLAGVLGAYLAWLGWGVLLIGGFLGFLLGGVIGGGLMLVHRAGRKSKIPFGPFMVTGAFTAILTGQRIFDGYLNLMGI